ncbi:hypothetical protein [Vallitalea sp.]|jgi:hypothetical protein|uniref:hypothetical protein n=1 Tax=Vallitalea sp. TaxID=1882829 RepID=UPI0025FF0E88|nr:hypothetical protein [Vallitalea sp.]MCT4686047.1 hypothetical protein [Vallitalea sp.]
MKMKNKTRLIILVLLIISITINVCQIVHIKNIRKDIAVSNMNLLIEFDNYLFAIDKYLVKESYSQEDLELLNDVTKTYKSIMLQNNFNDIYEQLNKQNFIINGLLEEEITEQEFANKLKDIISVSVKLL